MDIIVGICDVPMERYHISIWDPHTVISDNGKYFKASLTDELSDSMGKMHSFSKPYHPEVNGLGEARNKPLLATLKEILKATNTISGKSATNSFVGIQDNPEAFNKDSAISSSI